MDDQQAVSSSMDDKKEQGPQQSDEVWSDLANPCGKEFELPSVTSPLSSKGSDDNDNLASPFQLLDPLNVIDENFLEEMIDPSCGGNLADSLPILEMAPLCPTISMDDELKGVSEGNKEVNVPVTDGPSLLEFDIDSFLKSQEFKVGDFSNPPSLSSTASKYPETIPISGHFSADGFVFGSGILQPVQYQSQDILVGPHATWLGSNDFIIGDHAYLSNSSNEVARIPIRANTTGLTASPHMYDGLHYCVFPTGILANISISTNSERVTQTRAPLSYFLGREENGQAFSLDLFQVGHDSSYVSGDNGVLKYIGYDGGRDFGGKGTFEGPVSFYLGPQTGGLNLSTESADTVPVTLSESCHPSAAMEKKTEENHISNKGKGKLLNDQDKEEMPRYNQKAKRGRGQANKRPRHGAPKQCNAAGNLAASVFNGLSRESSPARAVQKALREAREALENYPSQGMLRPRKLVFKDTSSINKSEN